MKSAELPTAGGAPRSASDLFKKPHAARYRVIRWLNSLMYWRVHLALSPTNALPRARLKLFQQTASKSPASEVAVSLRLTFAITVLMIAGAAIGQALYKYQDENGDWIYTDRSPPEEESVEIRELPTGSKPPTTCQYRSNHRPVRSP